MIFEQAALLCSRTEREKKGSTVIFRKTGKTNHRGTATQRKPEKREYSKSPLGFLRVAVSLWFVLFNSSPSSANAQDIPSPPREFRGVWVASVANIDWPSKKGLSPKEQQSEFRAILDKCKELGLNAVILQVRPMCDALYASKLEPWSEFLTGATGKAPDPNYDPLEFAVKEAHQRGLELHAWFNPYRARSPAATSPLPDDHLVKKRPDLAKPYGKHYWLNPTHPDVQDHTLAVFLDVVKRYDVDGIHIDDYFYPYKERDADEKIIPFPDDDTWEKYQKDRGKLARDDWRRDAVNRFVERMYVETKKLKPWVKVGISPFGIWRPGHPPGIEGLDQYAELYADAKLWFNKGWVDYFTPQLYWPIAQEKQSFPKLLGWWAGENSKVRHLWPGNIPSRVSSKAKGWSAGEIVEQIKTTRAQKGATGNIHFSMKTLMKNTSGVADELKKVYAIPALVPASPWLSKDKPATPRAEWKDADGKSILQLRAGEGIRLFVVRTRTDDKWNIAIQPAKSDGTASLLFQQRPQRVVITAIDRFGNESSIVEPEKSNP